MDDPYKGVIYLPNKDYFIIYILKESRPMISFQIKSVSAYCICHRYFTVAVLNTALT